MSDEKLPVQDQEFWRQRLVGAHVTGRGLHTAIYDTDPDTWGCIQGNTKGVLYRYLEPGMTLLDAGCGYGAIAGLMPPWVTYVGVDISPDLLEIARKREPGRTFILADLGNMAFFGDKSIHVAVARSLKKMLVDNLGAAAWDRVCKELLRVAKIVVIIEYERSGECEVLT